MIKFNSYKGQVYTLKRDMFVGKGRSASMLKAGTTVKYQKLRNGQYFYA